MSSSLLLICVATHVVFDGFLQSREMGQKKSTEIKWLLKHLLIIQFGFTFVLSFLIDPLLAFKFALCNTVVHGVIDWHIWRGYKYSVIFRLLRTKPEDLYYKSEAEWDMATSGDKRKYLEIAGRNWKYWEDHLFYSTILTDQALHFATLVVLCARFFS